MVKRCVCANGVSLRHIWGKNGEKKKRLPFSQVSWSYCLCFFQKTCGKKTYKFLRKKRWKSKRFFLFLCMRCWRQVEDIDIRTSTPSRMRDIWETSGGQMEDKQKSCGPGMQPFGKPVGKKHMSTFFTCWSFCFAESVGDANLKNDSSCTCSSFV